MAGVAHCSNRTFMELKFRQSDGAEYRDLF